MPPKTPAQLRQFTRQQVTQSEERLQAQITDLASRVRGLEARVAAMEDAGDDSPPLPDEPDTPDTDSPYDEIDIQSVIFTDAEQVRGWPVKSIIVGASVGDGVQVFPHTKAGMWQTWDNGAVEGNVWIVAKPTTDGFWYAATFEWLRPGQTEKRIASHLMDDHIKKSVFDGWVPQSGEVVGLFVSTPCRLGADTGEYERSNIVKLEWM